jgi:hypothetical protein
MGKTARESGRVRLERSSWEMHKNSLKLEDGYKSARIDI